MFIIGDAMNDKICGYYLDKQQQQIVLDESKHLLVVAGAGSGKTLTIMGKIYYLIKYKNIKHSEILCISFTKASANNLKERIKKEFSYDIPVYTFHKLALKIIEENNIKYQITDPDMLENVINNFFNNYILNYPKHMIMVLNYFNVYIFRNVEERYTKLLKNNYKEFQVFIKLVSTFIRLFKCNNHKLEDFNLFLNEARRTLNYFKYKHEKIFLILSLNIYLLYENYLENNNEIDFDDMITAATNIVKEKGINSGYKYVIIDEYQDTSYVRFCLIKSILDKTESKLMVVGDDFQSIYRFTGCDLSLFVDFKKYFQDNKIMKIETTYRNSQELIKVAGDFIMKNNRQIRKDLISHKHLSKPIKIVYYCNIKDSFLKLVLKIYNENKKSILVLGRNNNDVNLVLGEKFKLKGFEKIVYLGNKDVDIKFLTAHRSKGLEEECVIIINLENKILGFPNKIDDEKILRFVNRNDEKYMYEEERRLFYVALTRTKSYVYLLTQKNNSSIFVEELIRNYKNEIEIINI